MFDRPGGAGLHYWLLSGWIRLEVQSPLRAQLSPGYSSCRPGIGQDEDHSHHSASGNIFPGLLCGGEHQHRGGTSSIHPGRRQIRGHPLHHIRLDCDDGGHIAAIRLSGCLAEEAGDIPGDEELEAAAIPGGSIPLHPFRLLGGISGYRQDPCLGHVRGHGCPGPDLLLEASHRVECLACSRERGCGRLHGTLRLAGRILDLQAPS